MGWFKALAAVSARALPPSRRDDHFVFDMKNGLRVWLGEAVARGEVAAKDAQDAIRRIDAGKAADEAEDKLKLALGPIKDSFGMYKIGQKLMTDFHRWWNVKVEFKPEVKCDLVHIKGWPNGRKLLSGTRYRVDNVKVMDLQIGKPGIKAAAKESARFGLILVVAMDAVQFARDHNLAHFLASLTLDVPSVALASAIGGFVSTAAVGWPAVAAFALGPAAIGLVIGIAIGAGLWYLDKRFNLTGKLTAAYERALDSLEQRWEKAKANGEQTIGKLVFGNMLEEMQRSVDHVMQRITESAL